jgi:excisionase family DNA binding protein
VPISSRPTNGVRSTQSNDEPADQPSPLDAARIDSAGEPMHETKPVLTVTEAAGLLGISRALAYQLVGRGQIPAVHLGRRIVVPRRAIDALLATATQQSV